jgi:hypothetical protein
VHRVWIKTVDIVLINNFVLRANKGLLLLTEFVKNVQTIVFFVKKVEKVNVIMLVVKLVLES